MKIVVTGSLGHISKPLVQELVKKGHSVTVISSNAARQADIEALGAKAAIGTMKDADFLTATFTGAESISLTLDQPSTTIILNAAETVALQRWLHRDERQIEMRRMRMILLHRVAHRRPAR